MGIDTIDLDLAGHRVRVICDDESAAARLRTALEGHRIDDPAPVGFQLRLPQEGKRFHVLLDRSGFVLARTRRLDHGLAVLASHLAAFLPPPERTVRLRAKALVDQHSRATLACFPLFTDPPPIERQLARARHRVVDRLVVDISEAGVVSLTAPPWHELAAEESIEGHVGAETSGSVIERILVPQLVSGTPSVARTVAFVAAAAAEVSSRPEVLDFATSLAGHVRAIGVRPDDRSGRYEALA